MNGDDFRPGDDPEMRRELTKADLIVLILATVSGIVVGALLAFYGKA